MKNESKKRNRVAAVITRTVRTEKLLSIGIIAAVFGAVLAALLPPLVLERMVNQLTQGEGIAWRLIMLYFALLVLTGLLESLREVMLTVFGQKITHALRSAMSGKLLRLPADSFVKQEPGVTASRMVGDVNTVETLFTSGIISMAADAFKVVSIFAVIFVKNRGLSFMLLLCIPVLFVFTRIVQKRMLKAQIENRAAVGRGTNHIPETLHCIRTIHTLGKERYMRDKYDVYTEEGYRAMEKTNFYDSIYSPVILMINAALTGIVLLLAASGNPSISEFFGMSVGTAVAVISYISQVFTPLESIGMEIQTIQSAIAGAHRLEEFLEQPERWDTDDSEAEDTAAPSIELADIVFGYEKEKTVLNHVSFQVQQGEHVTLVGRTGAGKSTIFKLLLGLYRPESGSVRIHGRDASRIPDREKRKIFGYVEQSFRMFPGTVADQISLFDASITADQIVRAAKLAGIHDVIASWEEGYRTPCRESLFSQGQWQLLSIARAVAAEPEILLLDEITANLDAQTEHMVLDALRHASENRTVVSISHRLYEETGRRIEISGKTEDSTDKD